MDWVLSFGTSSTHFGLFLNSCCCTISFYPLTRNDKFHEALLVRHAVATRAGSPGPGHYNNLLNPPVSPSRSSRTVPPSLLLQRDSGGGGGGQVSVSSADLRARDQMGSPSPGARGYVFGKENQNRTARSGSPFSQRMSKLLLGTNAIGSGGAGGGGGNTTYDLSRSGVWWGGGNSMSARSSHGRSTGGNNNNNTLLSATATARLLQEQLSIPDDRKRNRENLLGSASIQL